RGHECSCGWRKDEGPCIHKELSRGIKVFDGGSMGLKGGMVVVEVVVKWNDGGIGKGEVVDSFDEMSITFVLANFLRGFLVEEDALKAILKVINEGSYGWFFSSFDV
ncbi:hypothetical protein Tco_1096944, partial [Tanacetum coccineum]